MADLKKNVAVIELYLSFIGQLEAFIEIVYFIWKVFVDELKYFADSR